MKQVWFADAVCIWRIILSSQAEMFIILYYKYN